MVIEGLRYSNKPLLETDLTRHDPNNPGEEQDYDGTNQGKRTRLEAQFYGMTSCPPPSDLMNEIDNWWTGPWPVFHVKIDKTTIEGFVFRYQVARDLLGFTQVEEAYLVSNSPDDPITDEAYAQALAEDVVAEWFAEGIRHWIVFLGGLAASVACMATEKFPAYWPVAAVLIAVYIGLFATDIILTTFDIMDLTDDPWNRFWMIVFVGLGILLTITGVDFVRPGMALWMTERAAGETASLFTLLVHGMTDMSVIFLCFKILLVLWVFVVAGLVWTLTVLGGL
ncbi:MAG: hypothetical protein EAX95_02075 [Candidatus Thorarchaeota archaeon]|nr:hypothetical protein [Candidatus Thorarchaeota archaeon]